MIKKKLIDSSFSKKSLPLISLEKSSNNELRWKQEFCNLASVAIIFCSTKVPFQPAEIILIKRSMSVTSHKGQMAFPGGKAEKNDEGPIETAKRESYEEININPKLLKFQYLLSPVTSSNRLQVWPVVFTAQVAKEQLIASSEVDEIFFCPWPKLTPNLNTPFFFSFREKKIHSDLYLVDKYSIWGLTARIITKLALS